MGMLIAAAADVDKALDSLETALANLETLAAGAGASLNRVAQFKRSVARHPTLRHYIGGKAEDAAKLSEIFV